MEAHPNYNVGPQPIARARAAVGTHTHPFCFYNFKSQTGCVSSATVFTALPVSASVPPPHFPQFFACPLCVRLSSATVFTALLMSAFVPPPHLPQFFACPPLVRLSSAPIFTALLMSAFVLSAPAESNFLIGRVDREKPHMPMGAEFLSVNPPD